MKPGDLLFECSLPGTPVVLKNSKNIIPIKRGGKTLHIPVPSKAVKAWRKAVTPGLRLIVPKTPIDVPIRMLAFFCGPWLTVNSMPDLSNLYQGPEDLLQECKVITDDQNIRSHDGSRAVPLCLYCTERALLTRGPRKGMRKDSCGHKKTCPYACIKIQLRYFNDEELEALALTGVGKIPLSF